MGVQARYLRPSKESKKEQSKEHAADATQQAIWNCGSKTTRVCPRSRSRKVKTGEESKPQRTTGRTKELLYMDYAGRKFLTAIEYFRQERRRQTTKWDVNLHEKPSERESELHQWKTERERCNSGNVQINQMDKEPFERDDRGGGEKKKYKTHTQSKATYLVREIDIQIISMGRQKEAKSGGSEGKMQTSILCMLVDSQGQTSWCRR